MEENVRTQPSNRRNRQGRFSQGESSSKPAAIARLDTGLGLLPYALLALVVLLWLISLPLTDPRAMTDIGLLAVLPVTFYAALIVLIISFSLLVFRQPQRTRALTLHLVALIAMFHATPAIVYGTLRYSWAWKHVGLVDYIQRHGSVNPDIPVLNAYHNWPGFFALNAFLTEAAGLDNALPYAAWGSFFFNMLFLGGLLLIFRALTSDLRLVWMATWFFFLANWVGQDYFAPQSLVYVFYLVLLGIVLNWFRLALPPQEGRIRRWSRIPLLSRLFNAVFEHSASAAIVQPSQPAQRLLLMGAAILLIVVINFSHQLTPFITFGALLLLTLFQVIYPRGLALLAIVLTAAWIWLVATDFMGENLRSVIDSFGAVESNVSGNLINLDVASTGQVIVAILGRGLTLLVLVLAALGYFRRLRNGRFDLAVLLLGVAPFFMLLANAYGGEILFRIYFFAVPFMAFLIAGLFYPRLDSGRSLKTPITAAALSLIMLIGFLFAYYGKEKQYYFSPDEVAAAEYMYNTAPPGSLIVEGTRNYPSMFRNYEQFTFVPIAREPEENRKLIINQPEEVFSRWMGNSDYPAAYLLITRSMKAEIDMVGEMPAGSLDQIEATLRQSDRFTILFSNKDATIFVLRDRQ